MTPPPRTSNELPALRRLSRDAIGPVCLVTGGNGYVGGALVRRLLTQGCEVRAFDLAPYPSMGGEGSTAGAAREEAKIGASAAGRLESLVGDVRIYSDLRAACEGVDTVFHTVALINLLGLYRPELRRKVFDVNVLGTQQVIRACHAARVRKLIHTSTINVAMGTAVRDGDESTRTIASGDFLDLYGETKALSERAVLDADTPGGLRTVALRPGGIWGPGRGGMMITSFVEQLAAGRFKVLIGDGRAVIDNTFIENAVDAHLLAAQALGESPEIVGGQAYFITDGEPMNGIEWFRPLALGLGYRWPTLRVPGRIMYWLATLFEWIHFLGGPTPAIDRRGVLNLTRDASFRIDKAREQLGYEPYVRSEEGLRAILPEVKALHDEFARR